MERDILHGLVSCFINWRIQTTRECAGMNL